MAREPNIARRIFERTVDPSRVRRLFDETDGPIVGLRTRHPAWIVPHGKLARFSVAAAHKMTRRGFDSLFMPKLVAAGVFKVFVNPTDYLIELHQIVAGASRIKLERAFYDARCEGVENVRRAIDNMLTAGFKYASVPVAGKRCGPAGRNWIRTATNGWNTSTGCELILAV
jgi:hypothetical protein